MDTSNRLRKVDQISPLVDYMRRNLAKGYKISDLRWTLVSQGYSRIEIDKALNMINQEQAEEEKRKAQIEEATKKMFTTPPEVIKEEKKGFFGRLFG